MRDLTMKNYKVDASFDRPVLFFYQFFLSKKLFYWGRLRWCWRLCEHGTPRPMWIDDILKVSYLRAQRVLIRVICNLFVKLMWRTREWGIEREKREREREKREREEWEREKERLQCMSVICFVLKCLRGTFLGINWLKPKVKFKFFNVPERAMINPFIYDSRQ